MKSTRDDFLLSVAPSNGAPQRLVVLSRQHSEESFRDNFNTNSARSRRQFVRDAADRLQVEPSALEWLDAELTRQSDEADAKAEEDAEAIGQSAEEPQSQATLLVELASDCELFHDPDNEPYVRFMTGREKERHHEVARVRSRVFRQWLARRFYLMHGKSPGGQAVHDALSVIEGKAIFDGQPHSVRVRVADSGESIFLDLCDAARCVVEIRPEGWRVVADAPVMFRRVKAMLPLPVPVRGGSANELRRFVNITNDDWPLVIAWLVAALRPVGPYPVLVVHGEQGSAKSTLCEFLRMLVDPNTAPLRSEPREPRDLMIAAVNGQVVALDNLSHLPVWLSDCLCRLATGGGFSTRTLYSDDEETIFAAQRPVILNGIEDIATRGDLLDRSLLLNLPTIAETSRRPARELMDQFMRARPRILGALLNGVSAGLRNLPTTRLDCLPRMADFALWASATAEGLGLLSGDFLDAYSGNRDSANETAIEASPVGKAVMSFAQEVAEWSGTSTELLKELGARAGDATKRLKSWPATPRSLSGTLRRLAPNIRAAGVDVEFGHHGRGRDKHKCVVLRDQRSSEMIVPTVPTVPKQEDSAGFAGGGDANDSAGDAAGTQKPIDVNLGATSVGTQGDAGDAKSPTHPNREVYTI